MRTAASLAVPGLLISAALLAGCDDGGSQQGTIEGYIYSRETDRTPELVASRSSEPAADETPVAGASVTVTGSTQVATTDDKGFYRLSNVTPGPQTLTVTKPGFETLQVPVMVQAGKTVQVGGTYRWALLIFLNADNDLEPFGVEDVNEMEKIGSTNEVAIVVMMDRSPSYDHTNGDWTETRRFLVYKDNDTARMTSAEPGPGVEQLGEVDMGDPAVMKDFLTWAIEHYPAEHYLVDFWDHGSGWRKRDLSPTRGVSFDDTQHTNFDTVELPSILPVEPKMDIVAFDSSLMQMMEVAYEIRHRTDLIIGSEESPPGEGYPYDAWIGPLVANPTLTPRELAAKIVDTTIETLGPRWAVTQSALEASQLGDLATALDRLAQALISKHSTYREALRRARNNAQHYGSGSSSFADYKDVFDYVELVAQETGDSLLQSRAKEVQQALQTALIAEGHAGSSVADSHGLSIYVPTPSNYRSTRTRYRGLAFAQDTHWDEWIDKYSNDS